MICGHRSARRWSFLQQSLLPRSVPSLPVLLILPDELPLLPVKVAEGDLASEVLGDLSGKWSSLWHYRPIVRISYLDQIRAKCASHSELLGTEQFPP